MMAIFSATPSFPAIPDTKAPETGQRGAGRAARPAMTADRSVPGLFAALCHNSYCARINRTLQALLAIAQCVQFGQILVNEWLPKQSRGLDCLGSAEIKDANASLTNLPIGPPLATVLLHLSGCVQHLSGVETLPSLARRQCLFFGTGLRGDGRLEAGSVEVETSKPGGPLSIFCWPRDRMENRIPSPLSRGRAFPDRALERFPKSVTRFSDKKRDQAKNRERFPIRMKREPLQGQDIKLLRAAAAY
jgi:hypothetical protein